MRHSEAKNREECRLKETGEGKSVTGRKDKKMKRESKTTECRLKEDEEKKSSVTTRREREVK